MKYLVLIVSLFFSLAHAHEAQIRIGTTTSVENSGLLAYLIPLFRQTYDYEISLDVVGSGKALRMGRNGDVDLVWVHSPAAEKKFIEQGFGKDYHQVMRNDFVLVGHKSDPANLSQLSDITSALEKIALSGQPFISRADDSGTNKKELSLWQTIGIDPYGEEWYLESGMGMGKSLAFAASNNAYIISDNATFSVKKYPNQAVILKDPTRLENPYSVIAVTPTMENRVNYKGAKAFIDWLISAEGQNSIASFTYNGEQLYTPSFTDEVNPQK